MQMAEGKPGEIRQDGGGQRIAADSSAPHPPDRHMIPVWFFVGLLLFIYGILIFIQGVAEWSHPPNTGLSLSSHVPPAATFLARLHPTFWWGILLIVLGGVFVLIHFPRKKT
jgi:hypothetical protein